MMYLEANVKAMIYTFILLFIKELTILNYRILHTISCCYSRWSVTALQRILLAVLHHLQSETNWNRKARQRTARRRKRTVIINWHRAGIFCANNLHFNYFSFSIFVHETCLCTNCLGWSNQAVVFLGRLPKVDLIILEGENVRPYVRPSVHKKFLRFQWNLVYR